MKLESSLGEWLIPRILTYQKINAHSLQILVSLLSFDSLFNCF